MQATSDLFLGWNQGSSGHDQDMKHDYEVNLKAELEIEFLHDQVNALLNNLLRAT
jgi:uncharacterized membrane protein